MNAVSGIFTLSFWVAALAALNVWTLFRLTALTQITRAKHMKQEIYLCLCFRLKTMHAGLSAETGPGHWTVCENSQDQKQGN